MSPYRLQAFSLMELLVSIALTAILLSIAAPSFSAYLQQSRQTAHINQMLAALNYARNRAISGAMPVSLCAGTSSCNGSRRWQEQLLIFIDVNLNGQLDGSDTLLQMEPLVTNYTWDWSNFRNQKHLSFKVDGTTHALNGTLTLCENTRPAARIVINLAGRARIDRAASNNLCSR
ncbi:GspH/FimT family pseudopilin [Pseudomonas sp. MBLB4136]|uniref:GspH/FimT family pseudopilin n=1 Tax=Pseudomonas sp. MBLB4136 TaxID=3451558 RepID=UPI003F753E03